MRLRHPSRPTRALRLRATPWKREEFVLKGLKGVIVRAEWPLECPISCPSLALEHRNRLIENLLNSHRPPSLSREGVQQTVWEGERLPCKFLSRGLHLHDS